MMARYYNMRVILSLFILSMAFGLYGQINPSAIYNPHIKYVWGDEEGYEISYGELHYDDKWNCTIMDAEDLTNEKAIPYLLEGIERNIQKLPLHKRNVLYNIHGKGGHIDHFAKFNNGIIQKDLMSKDAFPYGLLVTLRWKGTFMYPENIPRCVSLGHEYAQLINQIYAIVKKYNPDASQSMVCHSMGNRVFMGIFENMYEAGLRDQFRNVIMAAPDIEPDVFYAGRPLENICLISDRVTVYTHNTDRVLTVSEKLGGALRLGLRGVDKLSEIDPCISVVDASMLNDNKEFNIGNHRYYTESPTARRDMYHVFSENRDSLLLYRKTLSGSNRFLMKFEEQ